MLRVGSNWQWMTCFSWLSFTAAKPVRITTLKATVRKMRPQYRFLWSCNWSRSFKIFIGHSQFTSYRTFSQSHCQTLWTAITVCLPFYIYTAVVLWKQLRHEGTVKIVIIIIMSYSLPAGKMHIYQKCLIAPLPKCNYYLFFFLLRHLGNQATSRYFFILIRFPLNLACDHDGEKLVFFWP